MRDLRHWGQLELGRDVCLYVAPLEDSGIALCDFFVDLPKEFFCCRRVSSGWVCAVFEGCQDLCVRPWSAAVNRAFGGGISKEQGRGRVEKGWASWPHAAMVLTCFLCDRDVGWHIRCLVECVMDVLVCSEGCGHDR